MTGDRGRHGDWQVLNVDYRDIPEGRKFKCISAVEMAEHVGLANFQASPPRDSRDRAKGLTVDTSAAGLAPAGLAPAVSPPVTPPRPIGCHGGACTMAGCASKQKDVQPAPFSRSCPR